ELPADRLLLVSGLPARVEVIDEKGLDPLTLTDGTPLPLTVGMTLTLTGPPVVPEDPAGSWRWELQTDDGSTGFVVAAKTQLKFAAADPDSDRLFEEEILEETKTAVDG